MRKIVVIFIASTFLSTPVPAKAQDNETPAPAHKPLEARVEGNWRYGTDRSIFMTEFWVPIAQNEQDGSVVYGDLRLMSDDIDNREFNVGAGYRKMVETALLGEGIAGAHLWFDRRLTERGSNFNQVTGGLEWFGDVWDAKINGYLPLNGDKTHSQANPTGAGARFTGTQILVNTAQTVVEEALPGFDIELGWRAFFMDDFTDSTRIYAGAYHFEGDRAEDVTGWRARITSDITPDIQLGARFQDDDARGTQGFLEATIRFPFGNKSSYRSSGLYARLDESPERDIDIVSGETVTEDGSNEVLLNATTGKPQRVIHVDNTAAPGGDGSKETPFDTLAAAEGAANAHDLIYVHRGTGTSAGQDVGITLAKNGQMLIGSGSALVFDRSRFTTSSGNDVAGYLLAPATGAPVITNVNLGEDGVTVSANNVYLSGFTIQGADLSGIMVEADGAAASARNVTINNVSAINNGRMGIYLHGANGGSVSAKVEHSTVTGNDWHGISVYDDTNGIFEADLGGGSLGSAGNNVLTGNTLEDLAIDYDGRQLAAMNNWWGQASGPDQDNPGVGIAPQIYYGAPIHENLIGHWTFDTEWMDNATAYDRSGSGLDGTLQGGLSLASLTEGRNRQAILLDGQTQWINTPGINIDLDDFTLVTSIWVEDTPPGGDFRGGLQGQGATHAIQLHLAQTRNMGLRIYDGGIYRVNAGFGTIIDTEDWTQSVVVADRSADVRAYMNNVLAPNISAIDTYEADNLTIAPSIGRNTWLNASATQRHFAGQMDDVRIYNRALTADEAGELYRMDTSSTVNVSGFLAANP